MKNLFLSFILLCAVGCGTKMVSVSGTITLDGKPIQDCRVLFQPKTTSAAETLADPASGLTDQNGKYQLSPLDKKRKSGIAPGDYIVKFGWQNPNPPINETEPQPKPPYKLPEEVQMKGLPFTVPANGSANADFQFVSTP
jgi:hypothetical protein